ncbi:MAG: DUF1570 domain-containing protein [Planctomycetaceae bacterium]
MSRLSLSLLALLFAASPLLSAELSLVRFPQAGQVHVGLSLARNASTWCILGNDGQLHYLEDQALFPQVQAIDGSFVPLSVMELRSSLIREFGPAFEVVATKHFLVVQPVGRGSRWPDTFEQLHLQFTHQLKKRGVNVRTGKFTMVAVVLPDRAALHAELDRQKIDRGSIAGIYINNSNRVFTYDSGDTGFTSAILRHEAAHQSAFNSNIHSRLNETPKWIVEGLGMLFEASGMADGRSASSAQRAHGDAAAQLLGRDRFSQQSMAQDIRRLVAEDTKFAQSREVQDAYNVSWLMMFYLCERRPAVFAEMLNYTASRPPFEPYTREKRLADFERITGQSIDQFAVEASRFLESVARK